MRNSIPKRTKLISRNKVQMKITMNRAKNKRVNIAKKMNASLNNLKRIAVKKG